MKEYMDYVKETIGREVVAEKMHPEPDVRYITRLQQIDFDKSLPTLIFYDMLRTYPKEHYVSRYPEEKDLLLGGHWVHRTLGGHRIEYDNLKYKSSIGGIENKNLNMVLSEMYLLIRDELWGLPKEK